MQADRGVWGRQHTSQRASRCKQAVFAVTGEGAKPHTSFLSVSDFGSAGGVQTISVANPFLNVFISTCRLGFREKRLEPRQAPSRNSGRGNGIVK